MNRYFCHFFVFTLTIAYLVSEARPQTNDSDAKKVMNDIRQKEKAIEDRDKSHNGIRVGVPKVYDDSVLQQMLSAAQARLVSLQVLDQTGISARLGSITGASQQISSFGLSIQGPGLPGSAITANGATKQQVDTIKSPTDNTVATTTTAPVQNVVTTVPQFNSPAVTAPAPSTTLPSSFSVSASDILNEQMQLTFEIANLRLLLEGAVSDRILRNETKHARFVRPRTTVGFPITIIPDKRFKDAAAIVEVEVETIANQDYSENGEPPAITALLPREKTYNVAAIKDKSISIGAGVVTQVAGISGSYLFGRKTYYVVQDQDTLAVTIPPLNDSVRKTAFSWEFRPVLGERFVKSGLKQTFVQLSFPSPDSRSAKCPFGKIHIRTYWRKYDRNTGILTHILAGSLKEDKQDTDIHNFDMGQDISGFSGANLEDLGNGQMLVTLPGSFLGGTYVRIGSALLQPGSAGFTAEYDLLRFIAPIADLATKKTVVVTRDGTEVPLTIHDPLPPKDTAEKPELQRVKIRKDKTTLTAIDEANSVLSLELEPVTSGPNLPLVLVIGGRVLGYSDSPIIRVVKNDKTTLSVVLPTSFIISNPEIMVKPLMTDDRWCGEESSLYCDKLLLYDQTAELERLVLLELGPARVKFLLFGRNLDHLSVLEPSEPTAPAELEREALKSGNAKPKTPLKLIELTNIGSAEDQKTLRIVSVDTNLAKSLKQMVFVRESERPFLVAVPSLPSADQSQSEPKFQERVTVGADEAVIVGDGLSKVTKVLFQKKELSKSLEGKSLKITGLLSAGITAVARTQNIDLVTDTGKVTVKLEVVNTKIESVPK